MGEFQIKNIWSTTEKWLGRYHSTVAHENMTIRRRNYEWKTLYLAVIKAMTRHAWSGRSNAIINLWLHDHNKDNVWTNYTQILPCWPSSLWSVQAPFGKVMRQIKWKLRRYSHHIPNSALGNLLYLLHQPRWQALRRNHIWWRLKGR